jgi:phage terminase large subunit GpA-like protein
MNARGVYVAPGQKPQKYIEESTAAEIIDYTEQDKGPYRVPFGDFKLTTEHLVNATFWVSGLCSFSSKKSYSFLVVKWLKAVRSGDSERIQGVINTDFGELYTISGDAPEWEAVRAHSQNYPSGTIPDVIHAIFMTVDVQKNRLVYVLRAWFGRKSWLIEQGEIYGNTEDHEVWDALANFRESTYDGYNIKRVFVDSGYRTSEVYAFCRRFKGWAYPSKGQQTQDKPVKSVLIDINYEGKVIKKGLQLWHLNADYFKTWVHDRIEQDPDASGWYLPNDIDEDYCKQLVAEAKVEKASGRAVWVQLRADNHYLDCEYMQAAVAQIYGLLRRVIDKPVDNVAKIASNRPKRRRQLSKGVGK